MKVLQYLLLVAAISGVKACANRPKPTTPTTTSTEATNVECPLGKSRCGCICGRKGPRSPNDDRMMETVDNHTRIIGGDNVGRHEFPWAVRIERLKIVEYGPTTNRIALCGGSLLSSKTILTAAHCVNKDSDPTRYTVIVGDYDRANPDGLETDHTVESVEAHSLYKKGLSGYSDYDYGIIQLKARATVVFTPKVYPICLPQDTLYDRNQDNVVAIGWGLTAPNGQSADKLQKVTLKSVGDVNQCRNGWFTWLIGLETRTPRMICLLGKNPTKLQSVCDGDSGGPAMVEVKDSQGRPFYIQTGIGSFVAVGSKPCSWSVYAKVSNQLEWIRERIKGTTCRRPK